MANPSEFEPSLPSKLRGESPSLIGALLFEKAFDFYAWYLSYDLTPSKHHTILESLAIFMQIATLCFEGQHILSTHEEKHLVKEISELYDGTSNGMIHNKDLLNSLDHLLRTFTDTNIRARLVAALIKLEYKYSKECSLKPSYLTLKQLIQEGLKNISPSLPDLVIFTLCRELEALYKKSLDIDLLVSELKIALKLLRSH